MEGSRASRARPPERQLRPETDGTTLLEMLLAEDGELYRFALARCRDADMARDAVQEACLRLIESESGGRAVRSPKTWMRKVIVNFLFDNARQSARRVSLAEAAAAKVAPQEPGPQRALAPSLSPKEAACVRLRLQGHRYREIAAILGLHPGSVARMMSRARTKMRTPE